MLNDMLEKQKSITPHARRIHAHHPCRNNPKDESDIMQVSVQTSGET